MAHTHQVLPCTSELCLRKCPLRATGGGRYLLPLRRAVALRRPSATSGPRAVDSECLLHPSPSSQAAGRREAGVSVCGQRGWAARPHLSTRRWSSPGEPGSSPAAAAAAAGRHGHVEGGLSAGPTAPSPCRQPLHRATRVRAMAGPQIPQEASSILGACRAPSPTQQAAPAAAAVPADKQAPGLRRWRSWPHRLWF